LVRLAKYKPTRKYQLVIENVASRVYPTPLTSGTDVNVIQLQRCSCIEQHADTGFS